MRAFFFVLALCAVVLAGCSESHGLVGDAGPAADSALPPPDGGGCGEMPFLECVAESGHVCGDFFSSPTCVGGVWSCPPGTRSDAVCWCWGNMVRGPDCTCEPSGWSCPPVECPPPSAAVEGTWCPSEGQTCGECTDPCGWCNVLSCIDHLWTRLESEPPPGVCESFACGPDVLCVRGEQYCDHVLSDVGGVPDDYRCEAFPADCSQRDCTCFLGSGPGCSDDGEGAVELTSGGG